MRKHWIFILSICSAIVGSKLVWHYADKDNEYEKTPFIEVEEVEKIKRDGEAFTSEGTNTSLILDFKYTMRPQIHHQSMTYNCDVIFNDSVFFGGNVEFKEGVNGSVIKTHLVPEVTESNGVWRISFRNKNTNSE